VRHAEDTLQMAVMHWASVQRWINQPLSDFLIHIPNGGKRNAREAARLKAMGVQAGVSDLLLAVPNRHAAGLWIELKAGKNKPTASQLAWLSRMRAAGYSAVVCRTLDEVIETVQGHLEGRRADR